MYMHMYRDRRIEEPRAHSEALLLKHLHLAKFNVAHGTQPAVCFISYYLYYAVIMYNIVLKQLQYLHNITHEYEQLYFNIMVTKRPY